MRHVILLDNKITDEEYAAWQMEDTKFWQEYIGMKPQYWVIRQDYSDYPIYIDQDGDKRPTPKYLQSLTDMVVSKYRDFGTDFIMVMVHEDNWKSDPPGKGGIWGTAYAYHFGKQSLLYCRWDRDNPANTFGTAYHERHHVFDALISQEIGVNINPILGVDRYDYCITHGNCPPWKYIRHKENTDSLKIMAPHLRKALSVRAERHQAELAQMETIINLLGKVLYLLKMLVNRKNGVPRG